PARVFDGPNATRTDEGFRQNEVVYLTDVFHGDPQRSNILSIMRRKLWSEECRRLWHTHYYIFDIINYSNWQGAAISRYGGSQFYRKHRDTDTDHITNRIVTLIYYINRS